jgi:hypothetical protein
LYSAELLSLEEFAVLTDTVSSGPGRLKGQTRASGDGASFPVPEVFFDSSLGTTCAAAPNIANAHRLGERRPCVPGAIQGVFLDAACTQRGAELTLGNCSFRPTPKFVGFPSRTCPGAPGTYAKVLEEEINASAVYGPYGTCALETSPTKGRRIYGVGADVDLVSLTVQPEPTKSPTIGLFSYRDDGDAKAGGGLYDVQLGARCFPTKDVEGNTFCVPAGGYFLRRFADLRCSQPIEDFHYENTCARSGGVVPTTVYRLHDKMVGSRVGIRALVDVYEFGTVANEARFSLDVSSGECKWEFFGGGDTITMFRAGKLLSTYAPPQLVERVDP